MNQKPKKKILITGASGFIGRRTVDIFTRKGWGVRTFSRHQISGTNAEGLLGDIACPEDVERAVLGTNIILHLAAAKDDQKNSVDVNVEGTKHLVNVAKRAGVQLFIFVSTQSVNIAHKGIYGKTKLEAEKIVETSGIPYIILRPSVVYGPNSNGVFAKMVKGVRFLPFVPVFGDGLATFRPIHVDDFVHAMSIAIDSSIPKNTIYDIGGKEVVTFNEFLDAIAISLKKGSYCRKLHLPATPARFAAKLLTHILEKSPITESNILGSTQTTKMDVGTFFKTFHFIPRTLTKGFSRTIDTLLLEEEAKTFLTYILGKNVVKKDTSTHAISELIIRYQSACESQLSDMHRPWRGPKLFLGPLDAISRTFWPTSLLQQKLMLASAITEASPISADLFLPKKHSFFPLIFTPVGTMLHVLGKFIVGMVIFLIFPKQCKEYVGKI